jgi:hypothetical protein
MAKQIVPCQDEGPRVLLVEGKTDCHVVMAVCEAHGVPERFGIYSCGSDEQLLKRLNALIVAPVQPEVVGVVLDADRPDVGRRWRSLRNKLGHYPYDFPEAPAAGGTILAAVERRPRLGFWLMPDNTRTGMLEDFCFEMAEPAARDFAGHCVDEARGRGLTSFGEGHRTKAVVHTYLAWSDEPGRPLGQAITAHSLRPETELARRFSLWLTELFG